MLSSFMYRRNKTLLKEKQEEINEESTLNPKVKMFVVMAVLLAGISSLISYTLVLSKEKDIQSLHSETIVTQMDNIDIKNDVEFTKSLYNVYGKAKTLTFLHKPDKIIEVDLIKDDLQVAIDLNKPVNIDRIVTGY